MFGAIGIVSGDDTTLKITIVSPECTDNLDVQQYNTPQVLVNVSLNELSSWCKYELYDSPNYTLYIGTFNMIEFNATSFYNTTQVLSDGWHSIIVNCSDAAGNNATSYDDYNEPDRDCAGHGLYKFYVNSPPNLNLITPGNNSWTNKTNTELEFNFTVNDSSNTTCVLYVNGNNSGNVNISANNVTPETVMSDKSFFLGINSWYVNCTDYDTVLPQTMQSEIRTFIFDNETPEITLEFPSNASLNYTEIDFRWDIIDNTVENFTCELIINDNVVGQANCTNGTICNYFHVLGSEREYNWSVRCRNKNLDDDVNNASSNTLYFTIDTAKPGIQLKNPVNNTYTSAVSTSQIIFIFNATDNFDDNLNCSIIIDTINKINISAQNNTLTEIQVSISELSEGMHNWSITCLDNANNSETSETRNFTIDNTPPGINLIFPQDDYATNQTTINFTFNITDKYSEIMNCSLYLNSEWNSTNGSVINNTITKLSVIFNIGAIIDWYIECTDIAKNHATTRLNARNLKIEIMPQHHPCDLNRDGIYTRDWNDLMTAYKCFLGINKNCDKIGLNDWNNMKEEYLCYVSEIE